MVRKLTVAVRRRWFDEIKAGTKTEEYRLITPYWTKRLGAPRSYDFVEITLGYPKKGDKSRRLVFWWRGTTIKRVASTEWDGIVHAVYAIDLSVPVVTVHLQASP